MPPYCKKCPYNEYCEDTQLDEDICPMGYVPKTGSEKGKSKKKKEEEFLDPTIVLKIGKNAYHNNEYERAIKSYNKILELLPDNQEAQFLKKRTEYIITELSGEMKAKKKKKKRKKGEEEDDSSPLSLGHEPSIKVGHSQVIYKDSVKDVPLEGKEILTVRDSTTEKKGIAKAISIRTHGNVFKKRGTEVVIGVVIAFLVLLVIVLFLTGYLKF
jgi:hypothetical protein